MNRRERAHRHDQAAICIVRDGYRAFDLAGVT